MREVAALRPKLRANSVTRDMSTSLTSWRWQTFTPPLSTRPMSSDRKADSRSRIHLLPWRRVPGAAPSAIIGGDLHLCTHSRAREGLCESRSCTLKIKQSSVADEALARGSSAETFASSHPASTKCNFLVLVARNGERDRVDFENRRRRPRWRSDQP